MSKYRSSFFAACLFGMIVLLAGCGQNTNSRDDLPPSRPRWVQRSRDDVPAQQGVRAEPTEGDSHYWVRLEWYANPEPDVAGYQIWRLNEFHPLFDHYVLADLRVGMDPEVPEGASRYSWVDRGDSVNGIPRNVLAPDQGTGESRGYYWMIVAYDTAGNRSEISDSVYYRMINNPLNERVSQMAPQNYAVLWEYATNPDVLISYYMIRIYRAEQGPDSVVWYQQAQRYSSVESVQMDLSQSIRPMVQNALYTCQLNVISTRMTSDHADSLAGAAVKTTFAYQN